MEKVKITLAFVLKKVEGRHNEHNDWTSEEGTPAWQRGQDPLLPPRLTQHFGTLCSITPNNVSPIAVVTVRAFMRPSTVA